MTWWRVLVGLTIAGAVAGSAAAANAPGASFADRADRVCAHATAKLIQLSPPKGYDPNAKLSAKVLPALAPLLREELAIDRSQVRQWGTIGTPATPALRTAWARWKVLWQTLELPAFTEAAADASRGDLKGFLASFTRVHAHTAEARKLVASLGFHDCDWSE